MSRSLVDETFPPEYDAAVRRVIAQGVELHLIAGEKSAVSWNVPAFVRDAAASYHTIDRAGHLMMLEEPAAFCEAIHHSVQGE